MGCYGIGTTRCVQAIIEQNAWRNEHGIIWPRTIAPYEVVIIPTNFSEEPIRQLAERLYEQFMAIGIEVVLDDRDERFGVKIRDADLIGYPTKIIVGRDAKDGKVEAVDRKTHTKCFAKAEDAAFLVKEWREEGIS
jgi:prolyl-tRNA synthetase